MGTYCRDNKLFNEILQYWSVVKKAKTKRLLLSSVELSVPPLTSLMNAVQFIHSSDGKEPVTRFGAH